MGNTAKAIPYYAIFVPGLDQPIPYNPDGIPLTVNKVKELIADAEAKAAEQQTTSKSSEGETVTKVGLSQ